MTRDDIFWILTRAVMLVLLVQAVNAVPEMLSALQMDGDVTRQAATGAVGAVVAPLLAAWALLAFERRKASSSEAKQVQLEMRREDLLWVALKVIGAWQMIEGVSGAISWLLFGDVFSAPMLWSAVSIMQAAFGAWLLFGDRVWRLAAGVERGAS